MNRIRVVTRRRLMKLAPSSSFRLFLPKGIVFLLGLFLLLVASGRVYADDPHDDVIATVGNRQIQVTHFRHQYIDYLLSTGVQDNLQHRRAFLQTMIAGCLLIHEAREAGITERADFLFQSERIRRKLLIEAYLHKVLFDTMTIHEQELEAMFVRVNTTLKARHLYARTRDGAEALYSRLQASESFESLARQVFADSVLAHNGGSVGAFSFDEMDPAFEDAAYNLAVGEISEPVHTATGYSIIQLEDRWAKPLLTESEFATKRDKMEQYVRYRKQQTIQSQHLQDRLGRLQPVFHTRAFEQVLNQITGVVLDEHESTSNWLDEPLVSFGSSESRTTWNIRQFREAARFTSEVQRARLTDASELEDFIKGLLVRQAIMDDAVTLKLDTLAVFIQAQDAAFDDWIRDAATTSLLQSFEVPEDSIQAYFDRYNAEFTVPEQVRVWEILLETKEQAEHLLVELGKESFESLARRYSIRPGAAPYEGDLGFATRDQLGILATPVFEAMKGDILGPLEVAGRYALLKVGERRPLRSMTLEEARTEITERLYTRYARQDMRAHVEALRSQYSVTINDDLLASMPLRTN